MKSSYNKTENKIKLMAKNLRLANLSEGQILEKMYSDLKGTTITKSLIYYCVTGRYLN